MKKEMIISVLVGLFFGLIIVYGVYTARNSLLRNPNQAEELEVTPEPDASGLVEGLIVLSPEDETVVNNPLVNVAGSTEPNTYVVVFINDDEQIILADAGGNFAAEGELELGSNIIQVHAINQDGDKKIIERTVIYSTEPLLEAEEQIATASADTEEDN